MSHALHCLLLFLCFSGTLTAQETAADHPLLHKQAPAFKAASMQDTIISLEHLKGKVVVLNFWATWCKYCRKEFGQLNQLTEQYKGKDVVLLSISSDTKEEVAALLEKKKLKTTIIPLSENVLQLYGIQMLPTSIVIGKDGKIIHVLAGYSPEVGEELGKIIEEELKK